MSTKSFSEVTDVFIIQSWATRPPSPGPGSAHPWDHVSICPWAPLGGLSPLWCGEWSFQLCLCPWGFLRACQTMVHPCSLPGSSQSWCECVSKGKKQILAVLSGLAPPAPLPVYRRLSLLSVSTQTHCSLLKGEWLQESSFIKTFLLNFNHAQLQQVAWVALHLMTLCNLPQRTEKATDNARALRIIPKQSGVFCVSCGRESFLYQKLIFFSESFWLKIPCHILKYFSHLTFKNLIFSAS